MRRWPLLFLPLLPLRASDPAARAWPAVRAFTSREGLPQNSAMGLAKDAEGRLWVATQDGAAVFNGRTWRTVNLPDRKVSNFLRCVAVDPGGALWFGRQEGGLAKLDRGRWTLISPSQLAGATRINGLAWAEGALWIGTQGHGLLRWREGEPLQRWWPEASIRSVTAVGDTLWVMGNGGLYQGQGGRFEATSLPPGLRTGALTVDGATLWLATLQGLWAREGGAWRRAPLPEGWTECSAMAITRDPQGHRHMWVGSPAKGLATREEGGPWLSLSTGAGLPGQDVTGFLAEPPQGTVSRLWVALDEGLARIELGQWRSLTEAQGLPAPSVYGLGAGKDGAFWVGTRNGLWELQGERAALHFPGATVNAIVESEDGTAWAAVGDGLAKKRDGRWVPEALPLGLPGGGFRRLYAWADDLWALGGATGLLRRHEGHWEAWGAAHGLPTKALHSLLETAEGLWVGTEAQGLYRWQGGRWIHYDRASGLPNNTVMDLREVKTADGRRWLLAATESGGLAYAALGTEPLAWRVLAEDTSPALPNNTVYQVQVDTQHRVYLFTNRGVARLPWGPGPDPAGPVETFTTESGLPSLEFNGGASFKDRAGRIWGGSIAGVTVFDPGEEVPPGPMPHLVFEGLSSGSTPVAEGAVLGHRQAHLDATFSLVDLFRGEEIQYRTQLEGVEERPGPWTPEGHRSYPALPAGAHVLKVWARDARGREVGPLAFHWRVKPAPWLTWWAWGAYVLLGAGGVALLLRARTRVLSRRNEMLEAKVAARTHEVAAQRDQIAALMAGLAGAQRDVQAWARSAADDLAKSLGTGPIGVFILEGEDLRPLQKFPSAPNPSLATLSHPPPGVRVMRVQGPSGVLQGALLLPETLALTKVDQGLLEGFASQLGAVLELERTQESLRAARARGPMPASEDGELRLCPLCRRAYPAPEELCPIDGETLDGHFHLPFRIQGRYSLRSLLGEGGMGLVFEAEDLRLHRIVAVKVLRPELYTAQARARFLQEAQALAAIRHPGVIAVHDSGEWEGGSAFLVMDRLYGQPLSTLFKMQGPGHPHQVARLVRQGAEALQAAHGAGLLHRDLKPGNLFIVNAEEGFRVVLLDFGLAKTLGQTSSMTQTGMVIGTPQYMSPEQVRGQDLAWVSDLYSFAAVVFEALTGHRLITEDQVGEAFVAIAKGGHAPPSATMPSLGPDVDRRVMEALDPDPSLRPGHLLVWAETLARALDALPGEGPRWRQVDGGLADDDLPTQVARPKGGEGPATQA